MTQLGSVEHFEKIFAKLEQVETPADDSERLTMDTLSNRTISWTRSRINNLNDDVKNLQEVVDSLSSQIQELEMENRQLKKEITLNKNLKNFMTEDFDINEYTGVTL